MKFRLLTCHQSFNSLLQACMSLLLVLGLAACGTNRETDFLDGACVKLSNHTEESIDTSYVDGVWTGGATPFAGNGGFCGVKLPKKWHEGLTVNVKWTNAQSTPEMSKLLNGAETIWFEKNVAVPSYTSLNNTILHFLPDGRLILTINVPYKQLPIELQDSEQPQGWQYPKNYFCNHVKLLSMTPNECRKRLDKYYETGK